METGNYDQSVEIVTRILGESNNEDRMTSLILGCYVAREGNVNEVAEFLNTPVVHIEYIVNIQILEYQKRMKESKIPNPIMVSKPKEGVYPFGLSLYKKSDGDFYITGINKKLEESDAWVSSSRVEYVFGKGWSLKEL